MNILALAATTAHERGLEGQLRRLYGRVQRKIEEAVDENREDVELEINEFDFIKKAVEHGRFAPSIAKFVEVVENEIDVASKTI